MKCPFCNKRVSKYTDLCPNCGQRIEKTDYQKQSKVRQSYKLTFREIIILIFAFASILLLLFKRINRMSSLFKDRPENNNTFEAVLENSTGYIGKDIVQEMIGYRDDLKNMLTNQGYMNIKTNENVELDEFSVLADVSLILTASKDDFDIKISISKQPHYDVVKSYAIAGTAMAEDKAFEVKEEEVKNIFDYLEFENGYQILLDGYNAMEKIEENKYQYIHYDEYNLTLTNEIHGSAYSCSYMISKGIK